jgi:hypothetical protein
LRVTKSAVTKWKFRKAPLFMQDFDSIKTNFERIASGLKPKLKRKRLYQEKQALVNSPNFNVYRILGLERRETVTHTPMIAELLDPSGTHGQGMLFLKSFIQKLRTKCTLVTNLNLSKSNWTVSSEQPAQGHGIFDVMIHSHDRHCLILIENKIDAGEQENQIDRYMTWLNKQQHFLHKYLVFLTPTGREPISCGNYSKPVLFSYNEDLNEIFSKTLPDIKSKRVRETVNQYIELIRSIHESYNEKYC